jgi:hypothetical protein
MASEREYIAYFRTRVEQELMLGTSGGKLKQRDFEYLARLIEEKSRVRLSLSTLKRMWKDDYTQEPHPSTLDAAASVLGYDSWQTFKKQQAESHVEQSTPDSKRQIRSLVWPIAGGLLALLVPIVFFVLQGFNRSEKKLELPESITFKADKTITSGVPNTVLFTYDVKEVKADSFFIQQSWNPLNKVRIDPTKNYLSSIYYTPGFHRAKLIVNDSIVRTARIHVKTEGWMPILQYDVRDNSPYYLDPRKMFANGTMLTTPESFSAANVDVTKRFFLRYYNIRDFDGVDSDNFSIEARLKHDSIATALCPLAELTILTEEHIYFVPITSRGCVGDLQIKIGEVYQTSKDTNLSGLGADIYEWQKLRIENINKSATVFLNDKEAIQIQYNRDFGKIVGLTFTFNGPGSVDYVTMKDLKGNTVYSDDFQRSPPQPTISLE